MATPMEAVKSLPIENDRNNCIFHSMYLVNSSLKIQYIAKQSCAASTRDL